MRNHEVLQNLVAMLKEVLNKPKILTLSTAIERCNTTYRCS